jgi:hypothetical protein
VALGLPSETGAGGDGAGFRFVLLEVALAEDEGAPGLDGRNDDGDSLGGGDGVEDRPQAALDGLVVGGAQCDIVRMSISNDSNPPRGPGRQSTLTETAIEEILARLCEGESLRQICESEHLPNRSAVFRRLHHDVSFQAAYAAARATGAEAMCDEVIDLGRSATSENAAAMRVRVDTVKWAAAKLAPRRWGDKLQAELSGPGGSPLQIAPVLPPLTRPEIAEGIRALLSQAEQDMGLPAGDGKPDGERLQAILTSGEPMSPAVYEAVFAGGGKDG